MQSSFRRGVLPLAVLLATLPLAGRGALAQQTGLGNSFTGLQIDGDKPISIESDQLDVDDATGVATFSGDVSGGAGTDPACAPASSSSTYDKAAVSSGSAAKPATAKRDRPTGESSRSGAASGPLGSGSSQIKKLDASDKVYVKSADQVATADKANPFDMQTQLVVMDRPGRPVARQERCRGLPADDPHGHRPGSPRKCQLRRARQDADGGRVRMMLTPGSERPGRRSGYGQLTLASPAQGRAPRGGRNGGTDGDLSPGWPGQSEAWGPSLSRVARQQRWRRVDAAHSNRRLLASRIPALRPSIRIDEGGEETAAYDWEGTLFATGLTKSYRGRKVVVRRRRRTCAAARRSASSAPTARARPPAST